MSFEPLDTGGRHATGVRFGYSVEKKKRRGKERLRFSISADVMKKMGWRDGTIIRLNVDRAAGLGQMVEQMAAGKWCRAVKVECATTGRGRYELSWGGSAPELFPATFMVELVILEMKKDGLVFELPKQGGES